MIARNLVKKDYLDKSSEKDNGGGSRTRTYEGLASGFTVRPLCRSGHSPQRGRRAKEAKSFCQAAQGEQEANKRRLVTQWSMTTW